MKKNIFLVSFILLISMVFGQNVKAQSDSEEIDFYQSIFGMEKKEAVAEFLQLETTNPFWGIYDEYEVKRKELGKERINFLIDYAENFDKLDDDKYDEIVKEMKSLRNGHGKLMDSYYKKVKKASGSKVAAQFFQIEAYYLGEVRAAILEGIPFIGEFDN